MAQFRQTHIFDSSSTKCAAYQLPAVEFYQHSDEQLLNVSGNLEPFQPFFSCDIS